MPIRFECPECQSTVQLSDALAGLSVPCPECRAVIDVPKSTAAPSAPTAKPSRTGLFVLLGLLGIVLLGVGLFLLLRGQGKTKPTIDTGLPPYDLEGEKRQAEVRAFKVKQFRSADERAIDGLHDRDDYVNTGEGMHFATLDDPPMATCLTFSPTGQHFAAGDAKGAFVIWDLPHSKSQKVTEHRKSIVALSFVPDGSALATVADRPSFALREVKSGKALDSRRADGELGRAAFSADGKLLATTTKGKTTDGLLLYDTDGKSEPKRFNLTTADPAVALRPDGKVLATGGDAVRLWDTATSKMYERTFEGKADLLAFSPDGRTLAVAATGSLSFRLIDLALGDVREVKGHKQDIKALAFSPDDTLLATGSATEIILWDIAKASPRHQMAERGDALAFSPGGLLLVNGQMRIWRVVDLVEDTARLNLAQVAKLGTMFRRGLLYRLDLPATTTDDDLALLKTLTGLSALSLKSATNVTDAGMAHLAKLTQLRRLELTGTKVTNEGLVHLADLNLEALDLAGCKGVSNAGLSQLTRMAEMKDINLAHTDVTSAGLRSLQHMKSLRSLNLYACKIGDEGLSRLLGMTELTDLNITFADITDKGLAYLPRMLKLTRLAMGGNEVRAEGLGHLKSLKTLRELDVSSSQLEDSGLTHVAAVTWLTKLDIHNTDVTNEGLVALKPLTKLEGLNLPERTRDDGLACVVGMTELRRLDLTGSRVTDDGLVHLHKLSELREVVLTKSKVTDKGIEALQKALPRVKVVR